MKLQLLSLQVSKHLQCFRLFLLTLLLCGYMQTKAETWTDDKGFTWSFTVSGTEATDIKPAMFDKKVYIYGDPNRSEEEKAEDPQLPFTPGAWDAASMRFSSTEGTHLPTIPDDVYFSLKTLIFDVSDVSSDFDLKIMNGWWSNTYYDHVKWEDGLNEVPITQTMANECAKGGLGRDLDLMLYSGSMTLNAVYYQTISLPEPEVVIPEKVYVGSTELTVTSIGAGAFSGCSNLTSVTIPEGVINIGGGAFSGCSGLTSVTIPEGVTSIGDYAFRDCSGLTSISVESGNPVYDSRNNCNALIETATNTLIAGCNNTIIPKGVTSIGNNAFLGCSGLTSVTIPEGVINIYGGAFAGCSNLSSVTIPEGVINIGAGAFVGCSNLTSVTIPEGVTSIGNYAFYDSGLATVTSLIKDPFEIDSSVFSNWDTSIGEEITSATLYVPAGTKEKYEATSGWNVFKNIVEMGLLPVDEGETIDIGNEINEETNLDGTVVDNVFVNISNGDGGFDPVEGCLIVSKPTDDSAINGKDIFGEDFKDNYTGIVFKVNEGKGSIKVEAETQGNMVLKVKIGTSEPIEMELDGKLKVKFPYNVSEETLVYIYGGMSTAGAKATGGTRASSDADLLKIYGFEIVSDASGIEATESGLPANADAPVYNLNGQRVDTPTKGIYIKNGRKVLVK